jgi:hypothetical protein
VTETPSPSTDLLEADDVRVSQRPVVVGDLPLHVLVNRAWMDEHEHAALPYGRKKKAAAAALEKKRMLAAPVRSSTLSPR